MIMYYVITINDCSEPHELFGPYTWEECSNKAVIIAKNNINKEDYDYFHIEDCIEFECGIKFDDGGGVYILQAKQ